jgi:hypothetical protein
MPSGGMPIAGVDPSTGLPMTGAMPYGGMPMAGVDPSTGLPMTGVNSLNPVTGVDTTNDESIL